MKDKTINKKAFYQLIKNSAILFKYYGLIDADIRGRCFSSFYLYARRLDDYVDGDVLVNDRVTELDKNKIIVLELLKKKLDFIQNYQTRMPEDILDEMILIALKDSEVIGFPLDKEIEGLFDSFEFDLLRRGNLAKGELIISSEEDIRQYFYDDFATSCYLPWVEILGGNRETFTKVKDLCYANRIYFNLQDLLSDIAQGLVNISEEDIKKFNIKESDIYSLLTVNEREYSKNPFVIYDYVSDGMMAWFLENLKLGESYINKYQSASNVNSWNEMASSLIKKEDLQDVTFFLSLERKTDSYMKKMINAKPKNI